MSFEHVEYKTARAFWEAHKVLVAEGCSLAVLTLPLSRTVGFVEQERRRYHSIGVSKYKATNGQYLPGGWGLLANSVGPGDAGLSDTLGCPVMRSGALHRQQQVLEWEPQDLRKLRTLIDEALKDPDCSIVISPAAE